MVLQLPLRLTTIELRSAREALNYKILIQGHVWASEKPHMYDDQKMLLVDQHVVYLGYRMTKTISNIKNYNQCCICAVSPRAGTPPWK